MEELEQAVLIGNLVWVGSLVAPIVAGAVAVLASRQPNSDRVRICFMGALAAFALGATGSYIGGEYILGAVDSASDLPWHLFFQAWHRMWYPLGIGIVVGVALALFALYPKRAAA